MKAKKIVLIGCGLVGTSFIYSAMIQGLANNYVLIDVNNDMAVGNQLDLEDINGNLNDPFAKVTAGTYEDCHDADFIVITAGKPQAPGESRLDLVKINAAIMKDITLNIKKSGFNGIVLIASNPVDILTLVAQQNLGIPPEHVIGSGTVLDNSRLRFGLSQEFKVNIQDVTSYIIGEHGDTSVAVYSQTTINQQPITKLINDHHSWAKLASIHDDVIKKAGNIIAKKRATFYGIGVALCRIIKSILDNEKQELTVSCYLNGEYGQKGLYNSVPAIVGKNGIEKIITLTLNADEKTKFNHSCHQLATIIKSL